MAKSSHRERLDTSIRLKRSQTEALPGRAPANYVPVVDTEANTLGFSRIPVPRVGRVSDATAVSRLRGCKCSESSL